MDVRIPGNGVSGFKPCMVDRRSGKRLPKSETGKVILCSMNK
jgi:hypothetical protein